jgi:hypothetical protein
MALLFYKPQFIMVWEKVAGRLPFQRRG